MIGFLLGLVIQHGNRINELHSELLKLKTPEGDELQPEQQVDKAQVDDDVEKTTVVAANIVQQENSASVKDSDESIVFLEDDAPVAKQSLADDKWGKAPSEKLAPPGAVTKWLQDFFTTGNLIVKIGVSVLFFGVAFLVKFAADHDYISLQLRLTGVALAGVAMLIFGWRLRTKKPAYALAIQGGGLGVLYITIFAAFRLYSLLPATPAFGVLFILAVVSAVLAVKQDSHALAVLGLSGGFLAPILVSTGSGNYVALFSYYLLLNLGIFSIAWFRSWRVLNLLGFLFTFLVASAWGVKYYRSENFSSTEPFLIIYFLLYVAVAVLFALRQPPKLKGYVDSTLVFGVPLVGFGLQAGMVNHIEYALAWSSFSLAIFYIVLAGVLWRRIRSGSRLICEAFLALGVIFATLTVPLALDAQWTTGVWALEGAAAVWIGIRQKQFFPRLLGYILQLASGLSFLASLYETSSGQQFLFNSAYIGALTVSLSGMFVAWRLNTGNTPDDDSQSKILFQWEQKLSLPFLIWGLSWWYGAGIYEIHDKISQVSKPLVGILFVAFSSSLLQGFKQKLDWATLRVPALFLLPLLFLLFPFAVMTNGHPFFNWNILAWGTALLANFWVLKQYDDQGQDRDQAGIPGLHMASFWLITLLLSSEAAWQANDLMNDTGIWWLLAASSVTSLLMFLMYRFGEIISWPVARHQKEYQIRAVAPLAFALWGFFIIMNLYSDGDVSPFSYLPVLNPLDLVLVLLIIVLIYWQRVPLSFEVWSEQRWRFNQSQLLLALSLFLWVNAMWLRLAHHAWGVEFDLSDMMKSTIVQAGISILWSITGLSSMIFGARRGLRNVWLAGAFIMVAVVVKLFLFDLANTGTVERIVSFMSVGILLLVVGYFAPVPPSKEIERPST